MALKGSINLSDLKGSLSTRGRDRYTNPELATMLARLVKGEVTNVVWDDLYKANDKTPEKVITNERAKWRNRAVSVFESLNAEGKLSVHWTDAHEMVITLVTEG